MTNAKRMFLPQTVIQSLLSGATQVSVPVRSQPEYSTDIDGNAPEWSWWITRNMPAICPSEDSLREILVAASPFPVGTVVWVPETWRPVFMTPRPRTETLTVVQYQADGAFNRDDWGGCKFGEPWESPARMSRDLARLRYMVEGVKAGRVQDVTEDDADIEFFGGDVPHRVFPELFDDSGSLTMIECFAVAWNASYPAYPWPTNPWRLTYELRRL